jgi:hypothetical protein
LYRHLIQHLKSHTALSADQKPMVIKYYVNHQATKFKLDMTYSTFRSVRLEAKNNCKKE